MANVLQPTANSLWQLAGRNAVATTTLVGASIRAVDLARRWQTGRGNARALHQISARNSRWSPRQTTYTDKLPVRGLKTIGNKWLCSPVRLGFPATTNSASYSTTANSVAEPIIDDVFEKGTGTWQYIVTDPATKTAVIIDPVLDYDPASRSISTVTADALLSLIKQKGLRVSWILETHAHADHLTAASYLQKRLAQEQGEKPLIGIGKRIGKVQSLFGQRYGVPEKEYTVVFDKLFEDDETFNIGQLQVTTMHLPGHTPDHLGYRIGDNVFCGDSIFIADIGTARCDFPGGSAHDLYTSGRRLLALPPHVKIWTGHDYPPEESGRPPLAFMTVREHREKNKHLREGIDEDEFVAMREERDRKLGAPRLLHQSLQTNIRAGRLPRPTGEFGDRLFHVPVRVKGGGGLGEW